MNSELRDKQKKLGFKRFIKSFSYSCDGLKYAYTHEQSMVIHLLAVLTVIIVGIVVRISVTEWLFCLVLMGLVLATELINTSIEATIDLVCPKIHPLAKIAKDTASAAVFVFSLVAAISGIIIFGPKILNLISSLIVMR